AGQHKLNWNGRDSRGNSVGSGIYFYKLSTPSTNQTKKMVIVK
ncbi:MAG: T9SS type A sorting domain-containing protein, partial [Candidatus Cloacimonetes bacterium]|nr:T9SS type A sorting domain-containing protein [Candidatus Cloacimonadota bacterium]